MTMHGLLWPVVDADECSSEQACCAHQCSNNPGGYTCSCRHGFALNQNDGCSCDGECVNVLSFQCFQVAP